MAITRKVDTDVYCDICGKWVMGWTSNNHSFVTVVAKLGGTDIAGASVFVPSAELS